MNAKEAARILSEGGLVAIPTETVYGLAADAQNLDAVKRIYTTKGRPIGHPLILHIAEDSPIDYWAQHVSDEARALMKAFWPGPLTLILKKTDKVADLITGDQDSVGIRCPGHPMAQTVLKELALLKPDGMAGLVAPSANKFGKVSPTSAAHVSSEFAAEIANGQLAVLDGGASPVGIESTILDMSTIHEGKPARILRPGQISRDSIAKVLGYMPEHAASDAPKASGTLKAHYAPRTPIAWLPDGPELSLLLQNTSSASSEKIVVLAFEALDVSSDIAEMRRLPLDPDSVASQLYDLLRSIDQLGYSKIYVQRPPDETSWEGVKDRLSRAVAAF